MFVVFDPDDKGFITRQDLKYIMMNRGDRMTEEEADEMCNEFDKDGDGNIEYEGEGQSIRCKQTHVLLFLLVFCCAEVVGVLAEGSEKQKQQQQQQQRQQQKQKGR